MELWRTTFRERVAPCMETPALTALLKAVVEDDPRLLQGATTTPPPLQCVQDWPVEAACAIGYGGWQGMGLETIAEVEEYFARKCFDFDQIPSFEPAACRYFLNWYDDTPREEMRQELSIELRRTLAERAGSPTAEIRSCDEEPCNPDLVVYGGEAGTA